MTQTQQSLLNIEAEIEHFKKCLDIAKTHGFKVQISYFRKRIIELLKQEITIREVQYTAAILFRSGINCKILGDKIYL